MISRHEPNGRFAKSVIANGFVFLSGMTAKDRSQDITGQTRDVLAQVEDYLVQAGSSKGKMVSVNIWLADIKTITAMNEIWVEWLPPGTEPARATVESALATPDILIEVMVQALA